MQNRNALHHTIPVGSKEWILLNVVFWSIFFGVLFVSKSWSEQKKYQLGRAFGWVAIMNFAISQCWQLYQGTWSLETSLPLQLCSLSQLLVAYTMLSGKQLGYEFLLCWGAGAVHAFLTPEITTGGSVFSHIDYTVSHGIIVLSSVYATMRMGFIPSKGSWFKVFLYTQLVLPIIGGFNWILGSNYMFLAQKPDAQNPLIFGEWPYYIIGLEFVVVAHFFVFYRMHRTIATWGKPAMDR
jgi:hypothetical integral membrane protein (TIGR02206 family)